MSECHTIYCHISPSGKRYIGQTSVDPKTRWNNGLGYMHCPYFWNAVKKYGWDNIKHVVLCTCSSQENADFLEQWFIEKYDTQNPERGYNLASGGKNGNPGHKLSDETKRKISEANTGNFWDEDRKRAWSEALTGSGNPMYGRHHSPETIARMSENRRGKEVSPEMREFRTNVLLEANKRRQVPIRQLDLDGNVIAIYEGFGAATRATGFSHSSICNCCLGNINTAYGYRWEYVDEDRRNKADERRRREDARRHNEPNNNLWVIQYDLDGNELARFKSIAQASRETGIRRHVIADCCHGAHESYGEYVWRFAGNGSKPDLGLPVVQLDLNGNEVARYSSLDEACNSTGFHRSALLNCCKGRSMTSHGFKWEFIGEQPPSNRTGAKTGVAQFDMDGNEIARYTSLADAMKATGHDRHRIVECCKGKRDSYKGTRWQYIESKHSTTKQPASGLFS